MADIEEVISLIRACLLSCKGSTPVEDLNRDYKSLEGENIPYKRLGFSSLNELLEKTPGVRISRRGDSMFVEAIATNETRHIVSLVSKQKSKPKKRRRPDHPVQSRRPNVSSTTNYSRISYSSSSSRNTSQHNYRANSKPTTRNSNSQPPRRIPPLMSLTPVPPSQPKVPEKQKPNIIPTTNRSTKNATPAPVNLPSPPVKREANGRTAPQVSPLLPPLLMQAQPLQQPRMSPSERLVRPPPLPNLSRTVIRENSNIERRVTFAAPEAKLSASKSPPVVAPLPIVPNPRRTPPSLCTSPDLKDPREELLYLVKTLNLGVAEYKPFQLSKPNKIHAKLCSVTVGSKKYSSYPAEAKTEEEAEKLAAAQAVLDIHKSHGPLVQLQVTKDVEIIKQRIIAIVDVHNGVHVGQLPVYYKENHNETLPNDWIRIVEECPKELTLERSGCNNTLILWRYNPAIQKTREPVSPRLENVPSFMGDAVPTTLVLPTDNVWPVYVLNVVNTLEIWVLILLDNYNDRLVSMSADMNNPNVNPQYPARSVEVGRYYVVKDEEGLLRVRVDGIDEITSEADIFLIDTGDYDRVSFKQLYPLDKRFCDVPPQAVRLALTNLEDLSECDTISNLVEELLLTQCYYVRIDKRGDSEDEMILSATLYDTSGVDDVNVNELILRRLSTNDEAGELKTEGRVCEVFISKVELSGDIYVQTKTDGLKTIAAMINRLISPSFDLKSSKNAAVLDNIDIYETYLTKCPDGNWVRSKVLEILDGNKLKMLLIDFGGSLIVDNNKLLRLRPLSIALEKFPQQAHKVHLHNIGKSNFNEQMMNRLLELAPSKEQLLCKVIKLNDVPSVELFKRSQPDNVLISINNTLSLIPEIDRNIEDGNNNLKPKKRLERSISRGNSNDTNEVIHLRRPKIPAIGSLFDVHVTNLAANPSNFVVQPYNDVADLTKMMMELQESCGQYRGPTLSGESLREGKLCAAKYNDGWYRACINGTIDNHTVVVYLCDYGDMTPIGTDQLQPLKKQFTELPYQGIKARLYGIAPINVDWTPYTCKRFQDLVANKNFASVVHHVEKDDTSPTESILSLELIDTSTEVDVRIHKQLVDEKKAILTVSE